MATPFARSLLYISLRRQLASKVSSTRPVRTTLDRLHARWPNLGPSPTVRKMSSAPTVAPYGTWVSPISAEQISGSNNRFAEVHVDPKTESIYLVEGRPSEGGRCAIVKFEGGTGEGVDILPSQYSARSLVHEYGGGACTVGHDGSLIFTDSNTRGVFRLKSSDDIQPIVDVDEQSRYADFDVHPKDPKWVLAVTEVHTSDSVDNKLVLIDTTTRTSKVLCEGADFYQHPKFSRDGKWICWTQWNHPDMPWFGTELYVAEWADGALGSPTFVAGKAEKESVGQPKWHSYDGLLFTSDRTGFSQIYLFDPVSKQTKKVDVNGYEDADIGGQDMFQLGSSTYAELNPGTLLVTYTRNATTGVLMVGILSGHPVPLPMDVVEVQYASVRRISDQKFTIAGSRATTPDTLFKIDLATRKPEFLRSTTSITLPPSIVSKAKAISFPRKYGEDKTGLAHAFFIPPHNPDFAPIPGTKPPLIVYAHGGPTSCAGSGLSLVSQYWTSRGYAYVSVNYAGSTGYGRKYMESLNTLWGVKDVDDCASCVAYLAEQGLVDGSKVGITGQSSGGYTVLQAMRLYPEVFTAGNSLYGISNLEILATGTHKFESHYLFGLMYAKGTSEADQARILRERSPCFHAESIKSPLLLLQGTIDKVVPLDQALAMEKVLKEGGKDVTLVTFEGEGHGFRKEENVKRAKEEEEKLWKRTLVNS